MDDAVFTDVATWQTSPHVVPGVGAPWRYLHHPVTGESLYLAFVITPEPGMLSLAMLGEGDFFGEMSLLEGTTRTAAAQAVEPSRLLVIRKKDFQRLLASDPKLALYLLQTVCERLRRANEEIEGLLFRNILGRVAKAMLDLGRRSGEASHGGGIVLKDRFTQQELADVVGTTREPLTRALSSLRRAGLVSLDDGRYSIPAPDKLAGLCIEA